MPIVSMFYGIIIRMYANEHNPPHFHAYYQGETATFDVETGDVIKGTIPSKQASLVKAWALIHADELLANWELLSQGEEYFKIEPLR